MYESALLNPPEEPLAANLNGIPAADIKSELDQILRSRAFIQSHRIRRFLQFIVEESLLGQPQRLKEYLIGIEVFDRREIFDPRVDSIVRVEARRLRSKLEDYYRLEGKDDQVHIVLRKGSYVPSFEYRSASPSSTGPALKRVIEIAPFTFGNSIPNANLVADEIQRRLAHVLIKEGCFQVIARPQVDSNHDSNGNGQSARSLKSDYVLEGSLEFHTGGIHLMLQLQQSGDGSYIWSEATDCQFQDLACVEQLGHSLIRDLATASIDSIAGRRQAVGKDSRDFYLQGRYQWKLATPESIRNSVACFTKAVESDGNYAAAWAALAEALLVSSMFGFLAPDEASPRMKEAARKANSLNAFLPEAHVGLGSVLSLLDWDWEAGEQELQRSIQLDNHDPISHIAYGLQLACRGMLDSAVGEVERALELDPAALFPNFVMGWLYGVCRRSDEAISQHLLITQLAPDYGLSHLGMGLAYAAKGMFADAIAHFTNASHMKCGSLLHGHLGYCYAMSGRREEALREIAALTSRGDSQFVSPVSLAAIYCGLGDSEQALMHLEKALEVRDTSLPMNLLNPEFDSLRGEARFQSLRQRIGLAAAV
jgi:tetratricopeptide (TPR) repeat protein/TolB-like protein